MTLSLSNTSKNSLTITPQDRNRTDETWAETDPTTWAEEGGNTWGLQSIIITQQDKNTLSMSNQTKN